ncbi:MAG: DUF2935 domain-containing protein [Bacilli bacterium]|nr:DUF2935 domain-containing protein [Bacilli bacterium]
MISDEQYVEQSLIRNLFFLRTLREFCANINLSFYKHNLDYSKRATELELECERIGRILIDNADGNIPKDALDSGILFTPYTLPLEELTERLFGIRIATDITKKEEMITPGRITNPSPEIVEQVNTVNRQIRSLIVKFIALVTEILKKQRSNSLFSSSYPTLFEFMIQEARLYDMELERLLERNEVDPIYAINHQFLYNTAMYHIATFLRGLIDPSHIEQTFELDQFIRSFESLALRYQKAPDDPYIQGDLMEESMAVLNRFDSFVETLIKDLLSAKIYFIVEPIFLDNMYTEIHYFQYILRNNQKQEKEKK